MSKPPLTNQVLNYLEKLHKDDPNAIVSTRILNNVFGKKTGAIVSKFYKKGLLVQVGTEKSGTAKIVLYRINAEAGFAPAYQTDIAEYNRQLRIRQQANYAAGKRLQDVVLGW